MSESTPTVDRDAPSIPPANTTVGLRHASAQDVHRLKAVLAEAFFEDPMFSWLIPNDEHRQARLRHYFAIELRHYALPHGHVWTTDALAGAMLGLPPGKWRVPLPTTLRHGTAFRTRIPRAARLGAAMEWHHMRHLRHPHYYVRDIGVHPDTQGRGLGGTLMRPCSTVATGSACPPTSRPPAGAAPRCTSASGSSTSRSCACGTAHRCG